MGLTEDSDMPVPPGSLPCDLCGRPFAPAELADLRGRRLCAACRQEEEGCGCSDDDPE
ncbi:MAG: hypothetical protein ACOY8P_07220 [Thermodesulfobacteriota bacterium]|jgi:formylmethanofuran dehydrogenase subunit E